MNAKENVFIKWFGGISAILLTAMIISMFQFYSITNQKRAVDKQKFKYIEQDLKEIKADVKEINKKLENYYLYRREIK